MPAMTTQNIRLWSACSTILVHQPLDPLGRLVEDPGDLQPGLLGHLRQAQPDGPLEPQRALRYRELVLRPLCQLHHQGESLGVILQELPALAGYLIDRLAFLVGAVDVALVLERLEG